MGESFLEEVIRKYLMRKTDKVIICDIINKDGQLTMIQLALSEILNVKDVHQVCKHLLCFSNKITYGHYKNMTIIKGEINEFSINRLFLVLEKEMLQDLAV